QEVHITDCWLPAPDGACYIQLVQRPAALAQKRCKLPCHGEGSAQEVALFDAPLLDRGDALLDALDGALAKARPGEQPPIRDSVLKVGHTLYTERPVEEHGFLWADVRYIGNG